MTAAAMMLILHCNQRKGVKLTVYTDSQIKYYKSSHVFNRINCSWGLQIILQNTAFKILCWQLGVAFLLVLARISKTEVGQGLDSRSTYISCLLFAMFLAITLFRLCDFGSMGLCFILMESFYFGPCIVCECCDGFPCL